jgi:hypothetical protein
VGQGRNPRTRPLHLKRRRADRAPGSTNMNGSSASATVDRTGPVRSQAAVRWEGCGGVAPTDYAHSAKIDRKVSL